MIRSQYTNFFAEASRNQVGLLLHGLSGAIDIISGDLYELWRRDSPPSYFPEAYRNRLLKRGYFFDGLEEDENIYFRKIAEALHARDRERAQNSFWVIPTYRCNLRCSYCFQDHSLHRGEGAARRDMTPEEGGALVRAFDRFGGPGKDPTKPRYITLFGGEPLMLSVESTVQAIVKEARERGYKIGAVTNGIELEYFSSVLGPDAIRWLQVTLDGVSELHDKRRMPCGARGFDAIVRGIDTALSCGATVVLRTNVDRSVLQQLTAMQDWVQSRGWSKLKNFRWYMAPIETHANKSLEKVAVHTPDLIKAARRDNLRTVKAPYVGKYRKTLSTLQKFGIASRIETSACGAHTDMYFFDPAGDIYACAEQVGQPQHVVGRLHDPAPLSGRNSWAERHVGNMSDCSRCANALFCGGGCANAALRTTGDFFAARCNGIKSGLEEAAREFAGKVLSNLDADGGIELPQLLSVNDDDVVLSHLSVDEYVERVLCARL
jgi:uncharacterized protein